MSLQSLPPELLDGISAHLTTNKDLVRVAGTSRRLHAYVQDGPARTFLRQYFSVYLPYIPDSIPGLQVVRGLTTVSRNWDRKSFIARCVRPLDGTQDVIRFFDQKDVLQTPAHQARGRLRQTMGYRPALSAYEKWTGNTWDSRNEVLAMACGSALRLRIRELGPRKQLERDRAHAAPGQRHWYDDDGHRLQWMVYKPAWAVDGQDDISDVQLLKPGSKPEDGKGHIIVGRLNGSLEHLSIGTEPSQHGKFWDDLTTVTRYDTAGRTTRGLSLRSKKGEPTILSSCVGEEHIALWNALDDLGEVRPTLAEIKIKPSKRALSTAVFKAWTTQFVGDGHLAVGMGADEVPLRVHTIRPDGMTSMPSKGYRSSHNALVSKGVTKAPSSKSSVYAIAPLVGSSHTFLGGWYDGSVRLYDLRCPLDFVSFFSDPIASDTGVYSLLPFGSSHFVSGSSQHSLIKVYDLRGGSASYSSASVTGTPFSRVDYNVFVGNQNWSQRSSTQRVAQSSVYALASASAHASSFYVGLEDNIVQVDLRDVQDKAPDMIYPQGKPTLAPPPNSQRHLPPDCRTYNLALVPHEGDGKGKLMKQYSPGDGTRGRPDYMSGWDARWDL